MQVLRREPHQFKGSKSHSSNFAHSDLTTSRMLPRCSNFKTDLLFWFLDTATCYYVGIALVQKLVQAMGAESRYTVFTTTYDENLSPTAGKLGKGTETPAERIKKGKARKSALTVLPEQQEGCRHGEQPGYLCVGQAPAAGPCCLNHLGSDAEWSQNRTTLPVLCPHDNDCTETQKSGEVPAQVFWENLRPSQKESLAGATWQETQCILIPVCTLGPGCLFISQTEKHCFTAKGKISVCRQTELFCPWIKSLNRF